MRLRRINTQGDLRNLTMILGWKKKNALYRPQLFLLLQHLLPLSLRQTPTDLRNQDQTPPPWVNLS